MLAKFRFIQSTGDGYFGREHYKDITCDNIEVRDLAHCEIKARATMLKHFCHYNIQGAYFPYCFVTLDNTVYRMRLDRMTDTIETIVIEK